ncbi:MAG: HEAT repeat protein [Bradymonadia bacterium]|jgi:HEAT repeat protein
MLPFTTSLISAAVLALPLPAAQLDSTIPSVPVVDVEPEEAPEVEAAPVVDQLEAARVLLSGYHGIPEAERFESALTDPSATLLEIATNADESPIHRDRALGALGYWPNAEVQSLYVDLIEGEDTPEMVRHRVIGHLAYTFGDDALQYVAPYLSDDDVQFRLTAIDALSHVGTPAALLLLDSAAEVETHSVVLQRLEAARTIR